MVKSLFYIKLEANMDLYITMLESIYRGDNLNKKIIYLIPSKIGEIDVLTANVYLNYVRSDGSADIVMLDRLDEKYNESYYQYTLPVSNKLTKCAGAVCTWLHFFTGSVSNPITAKSGECVLQIQESKDMDDYLSDSQITALYQLYKEVESIDTGVENIVVDIESKADSIIFDSETNSVQLVSDGKLVGESVSMDRVIEEVAEENEQASENGPIYF